MLDEYKHVYLKSAVLVPQWDKIDKNDLCRKCLEKENTFEFNHYLAALICRYWGLIAKFYRISSNLAQPEDCYNWLIDAIMYALKHRQWENPDSPIYNERTGPDKVINRCMKSSRLIFYQFSNRKKRKKEYQLISIEGLKEETNSDALDIEDDDALIDECSIDVEYMIEQTFRRKEYFLAFILDCICIEDVFEFSNEGIEFNIKRLARYFRQIDENYIRYFSNKYSIDFDTVYQAAILAKNIPDTKLTGRIQELLLRLKHSDLIKLLVNRR